MTAPPDLVTPDFLAPLWARHADALTAPVRAFSLERFGLDFVDGRAEQLGVINLSRDSSYRESICHTVEAAVYRARRMSVEGCKLIDLGAESTGETAARVDASAQGDLLMPVVEALVAHDLAVSVETYHPEVAEAALDRGAAVINLTGRPEGPEMYEMVARAGAGLILCYLPGKTVRDDTALPDRDHLVAEQMDYLRAEIARATQAGVSRLWVDPGIGFALNLPDGPARVAFQTENMLQAFRFRALGWPVCVTMPSPVSQWRDEARCAETHYATLALLAKANLLRSHEPARVAPVLETQPGRGPGT